jgi:hypothetical protein
MTHMQRCKRNRPRTLAYANMTKSPKERVISVWTCRSRPVIPSERVKSVAPLPTWKPSSWVARG